MILHLKKFEFHFNHRHGNLYQLFLKSIKNKPLNQLEVNILV